MNNVVVWILYLLNVILYCMNNCLHVVVISLVVVMCILWWNSNSVDGHWHAFSVFTSICATLSALGQPVLQYLGGCNPLKEYCSMNAEQAFLYPLHYSNTCPTVHIHFLCFSWSFYTKGLYQQLARSLLIQITSTVAVYVYKE